MRSTQTPRSSEVKARRPEASSAFETVPGNGHIYIGPFTVYNCLIERLKEEKKNENPLEYERSRIKKVSRGYGNNQIIKYIRENSKFFHNQSDGIS